MTDIQALLKSIPFFVVDKPPMDSYVIAHVVSFTDVVVEVTLPEYCDAPAIIPTSEIKVKRGRRVGDYVKKGKEVVAQVIRVDEEGRLDLSMKVVTKEDEESVKQRYAKAQKVHSIVCSAANYSAEAAKELYKQLRETSDNLYELFEQMLVGDCESPSDALLQSIKQRMPMPSYTCEKEIVLRHLTAAETAKKLDALVEQGFKVYVTAPPKYKITVSMPSKLKAEAKLMGLSS